MQVPTLETERLLLRPWRAGDAGAYARIIRHPEALRYWGAGAFYRVKRSAAALIATVSDIEARRAVAGLQSHWQRHGFGMWAVEAKDNRELVGSVGLTRLDAWTADQASVEIGWLLAHPAWGRGFAVEAGRASLGYAFDQLGLPRIVLVAAAANARSERTAQRVGMAFAGRTRWNGIDVLWYAMDRSDWARDAAPGAR